MGSIDENGVLWNKNSVGKMLEPSVENNHCWSAIATACKSYGHLNAVGQRSVDGQEYSDCGVFGGWPFLAYQYWIKAGGVRTWAEMPYCRCPLVIGTPRHPHAEARVARLVGGMRKPEL